MINRIEQIKFESKHVPLVLLLLCVLAFGLYLGWMGFYWDDWVWVDTSQATGPAGMLIIDRYHRPLSGEVFWLGSTLLGENPLGWQVFTLVLRWLTGLSFWWALSQLWPQHREKVTWAALLFLLYPGFGQQFVSVNSSRLILPYALFLISLGLMIHGARQHNRPKTYMAVSLLTALLGMLAVEYYYGLELVRPLVLWLALTHISEKRARLMKALKLWLPYMLLLGGIFWWRYRVSLRANYRISTLTTLQHSPWTTIQQMLQEVFTSVVEVLPAAWRAVFALPDPNAYGRAVLVYYSLLVALGVFVVYLFLARLQTEQTEPAPARWWPGALGLGSLALLTGGLPFLATSLAISTNFPADRFILPMMFGASLLLTAVLDMLPRRALKLPVLAVMIGLLLGWHYNNALSYRSDWNTHLDFMRQLTWRVPGLPPGTALLTLEPKITYSSDNSLTAALNWIYTGQPENAAWDYSLLYLDLRLGTSIPALEPGRMIDKWVFNGSTDQVLALVYDPPNCLRVLHPTDDQRNTTINRTLKNAALLSNQDLIVTNPSSPASIPAAFDNQPALENWCYYYQQADLAAQKQDWAAAAALGEAALAAGYQAGSPVEWLPFIRGYAHSGDLAQALALTTQALTADPSLDRMYCEAWTALAAQIEIPADMVASAEQVERLMDCNFHR